LGAAGTITTTRPVAPLHEVRLGKVVTNNVDGNLYVDVMNGYELDELHNVSGSGIDGDLLNYDGGKGVWVSGKSLTGQYQITGSLTSSLYGTASWSERGVSASYADTASSAVTASFALTASTLSTLPCYSTYTKYALDNPQFPTPITYNGTTFTVATQAEFTTVLGSAVTGDIISLSANIDVTSTLTINKSVKVVGNGFSIQNPATSNTIATVVSVTANNVEFDSTLTVKQRKTNNTSVDIAVSVNGLNFISAATIEFMEFGYVMRGTNVSFNISGTTRYTGVVGNTHRHIGIYTMTANSVIDGVVFDFPQEATARASSVVLLYSTAGDVKTATLKVANTTQTATYGRQFFLIESLTGITPGGNFALIFDRNSWNDLNGGIGILSVAPQQPLSYLKYFQVTNNTQGAAAIASYKGLVFLDASGVVTPIGNTQLYYESNSHPTTLRVDYTSAIDNGGVAYENTTLSNPLPLTTVPNCTIIDNALDYPTTFVSASFAQNSVSASYAANTLPTKAGIATAAGFGGSPLTQSVAFTTPFADNSYAVSVVGVDLRSWTVESRVAGSFIINTNSTVALTGDVQWIAVKSGETL
jgi:hypothetical protein